MDFAARTYRCARRANPKLSRSTSGASAGIPFVYGTVAIVVGAVADFLACHSDRTAYQSAVNALHDTSRASSGLTRIAAGSAFGISFVDLIITIIIQSVADLGNGRRIGGAIDRISDAGRVSRRAGSRQAGRAGNARARRVVYNTIAIIINCIAYFRRWHEVGHTGGGGPNALGFSGRACAKQSGVADLIEIWIGFVGELIAVIVFSVADFERGLKGFAYLGSTIFTIIDCDLAFADAAG